MKYFLILIAVIFIGCGQNTPAPIVNTITVTKIKIHKEKVPEELLNTIPIPKVPNNISMQSQVAGYVLDLYNSASSCHENINAIKEWNK